MVGIRMLREFRKTFLWKTKTLACIADGSKMIQNKSVVKDDFNANMMESRVIKIWDSGEDGFARKSFRDSNRASWVSLAILGNH